MARRTLKKETTMFVPNCKLFARGAESGYLAFQEKHIFGRNLWVVERKLAFLSQENPGMAAMETSHYKTSKLCDGHMVCSVMQPLSDPTEWLSE